MIDKIQTDLKAALLKKDKLSVETLKGLLNAIHYGEVEARSRGQKLGEQDILNIISKEARKRDESIELYQKAGANDRADKEKAEKTLIVKYLPDQLSQEKLDEIVKNILAGFDNPSQKDLGQIIGLVKKQVGSSADGSVIAKTVLSKIR